MGCDIHMFVQYREKKEVYDKPDMYWEDFGGELNPGRNYSMFGVLAGVRYSPDKGYDSKGIPEFGLSYVIRGSLYLTITEDGKGEGECTLENAKRWASWGRPIINDSDGNPFKVPHPDWHSHSWLTIKELEQAYRWYKKEEGYTPGLEWKVLLKTMKGLEDGGKNDVVVVFWFDN